MHLDLGDWVCANLYYLGFYEPDSLALLKRIVKPGDTVVEAGSHFGYFTLWLSRLVAETGAVHAFEPHPHCLEFLERNLRLGGIRNVTVHRLALSDAEETAALAQENPYNFGTAWLTSAAVDTEDPRVRTTTLDAYAATFGVGTVDVVKLDVQGHELRALRGMTGILEENPDIRVLVEIDDGHLLRAGASRTELIAFFREREFRAFAPDGLPLPVGDTGRYPLVEFARR